MKTKMSVSIIVNGCVESRELYEELKTYGLNVIDIGNKALVYATIDIRDPDIESILQICKKYGDCEVEAHPVDKKGS
jgi:hypothetical protein